MDGLKQNPSGVITDHAPLFASSWVALFELLRRALDKDCEDATVSDSPGTKTEQTRQ
jgi:hypothetical protein